MIDAALAYPSPIAYFLMRVGKRRANSPHYSRVRPCGVRTAECRPYGLPRLSF